MGVSSQIISPPAPPRLVLLPPLVSCAITFQNEEVAVAKGATHEPHVKYVEDVFNNVYQDSLNGPCRIYFFFLVQFLLGKFGRFVDGTDLHC